MHQSFCEDLVTVPEPVDLTHSPVPEAEAPSFETFQPSIMFSAACAGHADAGNLAPSSFLLAECVGRSCW